MVRFRTHSGKLAPLRAHPVPIMIHPEHQRRAYLQAMGIDVWMPRDATDPVEEAGQVRSEGLDWPELRDCVANCTRCELSASRTNTVFGVGNPEADWLIIGEAPGRRRGPSRRAICRPGRPAARSDAVRDRAKSATMYSLPIFSNAGRPTTGTRSPSEAAGLSRVPGDDRSN